MLEKLLTDSSVNRFGPNHSFGFTVPYFFGKWHIDMNSFMCSTVVPEAAISRRICRISVLPTPSLQSVCCQSLMVCVFGQ